MKLDTARPHLIAGLSGVFIFFAGTAFAAQAPVVDITSTGSRVRGGPTIEERLTRLESVLENKTLEDFATSIEQLQQDLQKLQSDAETANHNLEELQRKQRELYLDIDRRLRKLETSQNSAIVPGGAATVGATGADERVAYDTAFASLRDGKYEQAITELDNFLKDFPNSDYAANAHYWLAEAHYVQHSYDVALQQYEQVVTRYPTSPKYSDALLKVGLTQYELGAWDKSQQALNEVVAKFPDTNAAQLAMQRLEKLKQEGH